MLTNDWPTLDVLRLRYIAQVLERNGNNKTRAADMLGIDRRTLNRILARERAKAAAAARYRGAATAAPVASLPTPTAPASGVTLGTPPGKAAAVPLAAAGSRG